MIRPLTPHHVSDMVVRRVLALVFVSAFAVGCDADGDEDGVSRKACGHQTAYEGDLDGYNAAVRVVENSTYEDYTVDIYISLPDGGGVSKGTVQMRECGRIYTTVNGSAGTYDVDGFISADSASGTWNNAELGRGGDWIAEVDAPAGG